MMCTTKNKHANGTLANATTHTQNTLPSEKPTAAKTKKTSETSLFELISTATQAQIHEVHLIRSSLCMDRNRANKRVGSGKESAKMAFNYSKCWCIESGLNHGNLLQSYLINVSLAHSQSLFVLMRLSTQTCTHMHAALVWSPICTQPTRIKRKGTLTLTHILVHRWYINPNANFPN